MIVSVTERQTFKRCQRQWSLTAKNGEHLTPIVSAPALSIGTLIHRAGEMWMLDPSTNYEQHVVTAACEMEEKVTAAYKKQIGALPSPSELEVFNQSVGLAYDMAHNYQVRWGTPIPDGFTLVQPEQRIQIPIPNSLHECDYCHDVDGGGALPNGCEHCEGTGRISHFLEMRLDGLIQRADGTIWVFERKTYGQRPKIEALQYNDQFLAYMWGLTKLNIAPVGGIAYDGLWKRSVPPRGRTMEDLFLRHTLTRSKAELDEFERYLSVEVAEMYAVQKRGAFTLNRRWDGCWDCGVQRLCVAMSRGEDISLLKRLHYTERTDDTEEATEVDDA